MTARRPGLDHSSVEREGLVARYVAGTLPPEQRDALEDHLVDCAACLDAVDEAEALRAGLAAGLPAPPRRAASGPRRLSSPRWTLALAAGLAAACLAAAALARSARTARGELEASRGAAAEAERRASRAAEDLRRAQASRAELEARIARLEAPRVAPVFALNLMRGGGEAGPVLRLPRAPVPVVLTVDVRRAPAYAVTLRTVAGATVWEGEAAVPAGGESLAVTLDAARLPPGDYVLEVRPTGRAVRGAPTRFPFRTAWAR